MHPYLIIFMWSLLSSLCLPTKENIFKLFLSYKLKSFKLNAGKRHSEKTKWDKSDVTCTAVAKVPNTHIKAVKPHGFHLGCVG